MNADDFLDQRDAAIAAQDIELERDTLLEQNKKLENKCEELELNESKMNGALSAKQEIIDLLKTELVARPAEVANGWRIERDKLKQELEGLRVNRMNERKAMANSTAIFSNEIDRLKTELAEWRLAADTEARLGDEARAELEKLKSFLSPGGKQEYLLLL